ncbi:MAG: hypothetical protein ABIZ51_06325 [Bacteroidia bacterium]
MKTQLTKLILIAMLTFGLSNVAEAQEKAAPKLQDINSFFKGSMMATVPWTSYYISKLKFPLTTPVDIEQVNKDLNAYLVRPPTGDKKGANTDYEFSIITKYKKNLFSTFEKFTAMTPYKTPRFFYHEYIPHLINFTLKNNTDLSLVIAGGDVDIMFDRSIKTSAQRQYIILANYILPSLKVMTTNFSGDEIKNFGMTIVYGTYKDSTDYDAEWVGFAAPADAIRKYAAGEMSAEKLIDAGETYVSNASGDPTEPTNRLHLKYSHSGMPYTVEHPDTNIVSKTASPTLPSNTYKEATLSFNYPSDWKQTDKTEEKINFNVGKSFRFRIQHVDNRNDLVTYAANAIKEVEKLGGTAVIENSDLAGVFAIKLTENIKSGGDDMRYIYYMYKDRKSHYDEPTMVSGISYGGKVSDFTDMEPQCIAAIKSIKYEMRTGGKINKYSFEYPMPCATDYTDGQEYVINNIPIKNIGTLLMDFPIFEITPKAGETIDSDAKTRAKEYKKEKFQNVKIVDTTFGGEPAKIIYYHTDKGTTRRDILAKHKDFIYLISLEPSQTIEIPYNKTANYVLESFKFE